jgi:undecaprenyl-diphosphatase
MTILEAIILGLVQGLTEFIPVSSSGHLILARNILGLGGENSLAFDAVLQLATVLAVIIYFAKDILGFFRDKNLVVSIIVGTIPAVIFGLMLESKMETVFRDAHLVAWMLLVGALIMYLAERYAKGDKSINPKRGFIIGLFQSLALVPGISRSGATISGGLFSGLSREMATRFSFLLSVPIIAGSGFKKLLDFNQSGQFGEVGLTLVIASIVAFISGLWSIKFLLNYLKNHKLTFFIWYRVVLATLIFFFI